VLGLLARGAVRRRPWGIAALAAYTLQPLLAFGGSGLRPRDLTSRTTLRFVGATKDLLQLNVPPPPPPDTSRRDALRDLYEKELDAGTDDFFQPRRADCPLCGSTRLTLHTRANDLLQCKPGEFVVDVCDDCGHLFQNPQLTPEGLDFYYRDFYDGEGAETMDGVFSAGSFVYEKRARLVDGLSQPTRWLDVGTGHGHFCLAARSVHPDATFDGLDLSESIEEACRTGWVDHGHRGLFPDVAPDIEGRYDVVSMFHYLEHTTDPEAEVAAAARALAPGGLLVIEVPNPESRFGRALGKWWGPLMQPQHLNLVSEGNLVGLLETHGFESVRRIGPAAHQPCDLVFGLYLFLNHVAPPVDAPWRPPSTRLDRLRHGLVWWTVGFTGLPLAFAIDQVIAPVLRRTNSHSAYQVIGRKVS
jgi:SAM-dependent methyltransferase